MKLQQFRLDYPNKKIGASVFFSSEARALAYADKIHSKTKQWVQVCDVRGTCPVRIY